MSVLSRAARPVTLGAAAAAGGVALVSSTREGWLDVRLPSSFWVFVRFRKVFPLAIPLDQPYCWSVKGDRAHRRVAIFAHDEDQRVTYERQRRREEIADAEWNVVVRPTALLAAPEAAA